VPLVFEAIKLNHDPASAATNALNVRGKRTAFMAVV
jgi:hypothetical protein